MFIHRGYIYSTTINQATHIDLLGQPYQKIARDDGFLMDKNGDFAIEFVWYNDILPSGYD
jgi:hypothetical protein